MSQRKNVLIIDPKYRRVEEIRKLLNPDEYFIYACPSFESLNGEALDHFDVVAAALPPHPQRAQETVETLRSYEGICRILYDLHEPKGIRLGIEFQDESYYRNKVVFSQDAQHAAMRIRSCILGTDRRCLRD